MRSMAFIATLIVVLLSGCQRNESPTTPTMPPASEATAGESAPAAAPTRNGNGATRRSDA